MREPGTGFQMVATRSSRVRCERVEPLHEEPLTLAKSILLVEDDIMIAMPMEMALQDAGCEVVCVLSGPDAITELERRARDFTVLVTDIRLPGISGWEVARRARELHPRIGIVYASGDSGMDWRNSGLPGSIFLQKPYGNEELIRAAARAAWD